MRLVVAFVGVAWCAAIAAADTPQEQSDLDKQMEASRRCAARDPKCDWLGTFTELERASLRRALAERGYQIEPSPWGKTVKHVHIYNDDVFAEDNWLQFFNLFHYTTRERAIRDELTFREGTPWDDDLIAESARRLRDPLYSSVIAIIPVKSDEPGTVNALVVTRDVWSLRLNSRYSYQESSLTFLSIALSENNFLGNRDVAAASLLMYQGSLAVGPVFIDKNVAGTHLALSASADERLTRQTLNVFDPLIGNPKVFIPSGDPKGLEDGHTFRREGSDSSISLTYPLWSLASEWGGGVSFGHGYGTARSYLFTGLRGVHETTSAGEDVLLPWEYELKSWSANANVVRQWGTWLKQRFAVGIDIGDTHPSLLSTFSSDPALRSGFIRDVFPRTETISAPYVDYAFFLPRYHTLRNLNTYDLAEDIQLGPTADLRISQGLHAIGADYHYTSPSLNLAWTFPWCTDGFVRLGAGGLVRIQHGVSNGQSVDSVDDFASANISAATPTLRYVRFVAQTGVSTRWNDTQHQFLTLGSDNGMRGYAIAQFFGQRVFNGQLEARSLPYPIWVFRAGGVVFYEAGGAANSLGSIPIYQDIGFGIRALIPQTSRDVFRFDLAFPMVGAPGWPAWHPQFSASFGSYF